MESSNDHGKSDVIVKHNVTTDRNIRRFTFLSRQLSSFIDEIRPGLASPRSSAPVKFRAYLRILKNDPKKIRRMRRLFFMIHQQFHFSAMIAETNLSYEKGFFSEFLRRIRMKFLPDIPSEKDLRYLLHDVLSPRDWNWLEFIPVRDWEEFSRVLLPPSAKQLGPRFETEVMRGLRTLSARLFSSVDHPMIQGRLADRPDFLSSFELQLSFVQRMTVDSDNGDMVKQATILINLCEQSIKHVFSKNATEGVTLDLVYRGQLIIQYCTRIKKILGLLTGKHDSVPVERWLSFFIEILQSELRHMSLRQLMNENTRLLAFHFTEFSGKIGEKYIAVHRSEYAKMFEMGVIGGFIVFPFALLKMWMDPLPVAPAIRAFLNGVNYSTCFVLITYLGGALATKQSSMTAATVAKLFAADKEGSVTRRIRNIITRAFLTQGSALLGNFIGAFVLALGVVTAVHLAGFELLSPERGQELLMKNHPYASAAALYAAIAGVCLFLGGLVGGQSYNWYLAHKMDYRLRVSPILRRIFGASRVNFAVDKLNYHFPTLSSNIGLGFLLGYTPFLGILFGLPLDIRHITFVSANTGLGIGESVIFTGKWQASAVMFVGMALVIGFINLVTSFLLTLQVALRARRG